MSIPKRFTVYADLRPPRKPPRLGKLKSLAVSLGIVMSFVFFGMTFVELWQDAFDPEWGLKQDPGAVIGFGSPANLTLGAFAGVVVMTLVFGLVLGLPEWLGWRSFERYCRSVRSTHRTDGDVRAESPEEPARAQRGQGQ